MNVKIVIMRHKVGRKLEQKQQNTHLQQQSNVLCLSLAKQT